MSEKDEEEKMTELTDSIHSLFRGYVNGFYAHKREHLNLEKENQQLKQRLEEANKVIDLYAYKDYSVIDWEKRVFIQKAGKCARQYLEKYGVENK